MSNALRIHQQHLQNYNASIATVSEEGEVNLSLTCSATQPGASLVTCSGGWSASGDPPKHAIKCGDPNLQVVEFCEDLESRLDVSIELN